VSPTPMCDGNCAQTHDGKGVAAIRACRVVRGVLSSRGEVGWRVGRRGEKGILSDKVGTFGPERLGFFDRCAQEDNLWSEADGGVKGRRVEEARRAAPLCLRSQKQTHYSTSEIIVK
jgi:hypothetical protein